MENIEYEKIKKIQNQIKSLKIIINTKLNEKFKKLIFSQKEILSKYLLKLCILTGIYFQFDNFIEKLTENNCQDIFSLLNMLLPYYNLNKSLELENFDILFKNKDNKAKDFESSYYVDHIQFTQIELKSVPTNVYLVEYFENTIKTLDKTFLKISKSLLPNWINVFPYTIDSYKSSSIFLNFKNLVKTRGFVNSSSLLEYIDFESIIMNKEAFNKHFLLGYSNLYGCIYNFLYSDIKTIKWMIFDILTNNVPIPNIVVLSQDLLISKVTNTKWSQINLEEQNNIILRWKQLLLNGDKFPLIRALILFYLRWESNIDTIKSLKINKDCLKYLYTKVGEDEEIIIDDNIGKFTINEDKLNDCVRQIANKINFELIYNYIFKSIQRFRYTWYGYICLDLDHNILSINNYIENYKLVYPEFNYLLSDNFLITPKNVYNFFKSLVNDTSDESEYTLISNSFSWDSVDLPVQNKFISRLNTLNTGNNWFNLGKNIARIYKKDSSSPESKMFITKVLETIKKVMVEKDSFVKIILDTMVINNMLSFVKYNPNLTSSKAIPDKNKENSKWKQYFIDSVDIITYSNSYNFLSNRKLSSYNTNNFDIYKVIKQTNWFNTFGSNWIAQMQVYHHILNQRVIFVTGATGVGKSTTFPLVTLYGHKMLFFNNGAKVLCTQPRTQPSKANSTYTAKFTGIPFTEDRTIIMVKNKPKEKIKYIEQNINYLQFKTKDESITDDEYHPTLRYCTDGTLFAQLKENYLLKKQNPLDDTMLKENLYSCVLVDEAHEHNSNMDMILTMLRFTMYINNQVLLGIVSATMENDEITYRKYYELIDDNWKWPLNLNYKDWEKFNYNSNQIDRRLHLSPPFLTTNFKIDEQNNVKIINNYNDTIVSLVRTILNTTPFGDILVFQNGEGEIKKLVKLLNENTPLDTIALPFYSTLDKDILDNYVKEISKPDIRKKIIIKKTTPIDRLIESDLKPEETVNPGTYMRFIIVATNIAEASITIDTLKFVIDTGEQKINVYYPEKDLAKLEVKPIAIPNQKQRKGRVGRVQPGSIYYLYDINKLNSKVIFKINTENITTILLCLLTSSDTKLISQSSDPYKVSELDLIPEFLRQQYSYLNSTYSPILYSNQKLSHKYKIFYPYSDGKYDTATLIDEEGKFYIVHPNELDFTRDDLNDLEIIERKPTYTNTPKKIFDISKAKKILDNSDRLTQYGTLLSNISELFISDSESASSDIKISSLILDLISLGYEVETELFRMILLFIIFKELRIQYKFVGIDGKADFLIMSNLIPIKLFSIIPIDKIIENLTENFTIKDIIFQIQDQIDILIKNNKINIFDDKLINILKSYYKYKIIFKIIIGTNKKYPELFKNKYLKKINIENNVKYSNKIVTMLKMLDNYNLMCLLIIKNYPYNIYTSVIGTTDLFVEYFNKDVNRVYQINSFTIFKKRIYSTNLKINNLSPIIFAMDVIDPNNLSMLIQIDSRLLGILKFIIDTKSISSVNLKVNKEEIVLKYGDSSTKILEKIDKIIETFRST